MKQASPINVSHVKKESFRFILLIEGCWELSVCFASEKHKLINSICNKNAAGEIKYSHRSNNNNNSVSYQSFVKKIGKSSFENPNHKTTLTDGVDTISLIVHSGLVIQLTGKLWYSSASVKVSKYLAQPQLKTTEFIAALAMDDQIFDLKDDDQGTILLIHRTF